MLNEENPERSEGVQVAQPRLEETPGGELWGFTRIKAGSAVTTIWKVNRRPPTSRDRRPAELATDSDTIACDMSAVYVT